MKLLDVLNEDLSMGYDNDYMEKLMPEMEKDIKEGSKLCSNFLSTLKSLSIGDIIEDPSHHSNMVNKMEKMCQIYNKKSNRYYEVANTFDVDFDNKVLSRFEKLNDKMDNIQNDMDTIKEKYKDVIELILDGDEISDSFEYIGRTYRPDTIDIDQTPKLGQ